MHEVRAYARLSVFEGSNESTQTYDSKVGTAGEKEKSYDVRFEVIRKPSFDAGKSPTTSSEAALKNSPPRGGTAGSLDASPSIPAASLSETTVEHSKSATASAVWQSSLTSLLSPISSFWPVSAAVPAVVPKDSDASLELDKSVDTKTELNTSQERSQEKEEVRKTEEPLIPYEFTTSETLTSIPVAKSAPATMEPAIPIGNTNKKKLKGAPPSGRIAERLAALRSTQNK